jgi:hypothetical protein
MKNVWGKRERVEGHERKIAEKKRAKGWEYSYRK